MKIALVALVEELEGVDEVAGVLGQLCLTVGADTGEPVPFFLDASIAADPVLESAFGYTSSPNSRRRRSRIAHEVSRSLRAKAVR